MPAWGWWLDIASDAQALQGKKNQSGGTTEKKVTGKKWDSVRCGLVRRNGMWRALVRKCRA